MMRNAGGTAGMRGWRMWPLGLLLLDPLLPGPLLLSGAVRAQPAPEAAGDPHVLARAFLERIGTANMLDQLLAAQRQTIVIVLQHSGQTEQQAEEACDKYLMPELRARAPELMAQFEDILVHDFTVPELQSIVGNRNDEARRTAAAKAGNLSAEFSAAGRTWGSQVGQEAFEKNADALKKLGLNPPAAPK